MLRLFLVHSLLPLLAFQEVAPSPKTPTHYGSACPSTTQSATDLLTTAQRLRDDRQLEAATHCFARAAEIAAVEQATLVEGRARMGFARAAYDRSLYDVARAQAVQALALFERAGDRLSAAHMTRLLASVALMRGNRVDARRHYELALETYVALGAERERISTTIDLARVLPRGDADARGEEALALARRAGMRDLEAVALHFRSDGHFGRGRFDAAIEDLLKAIAILEETGESARLATAYVSMGRIMRAHGRPQDALGYYDRAIAIQTTLRDLSGRMQSLNAKAVALGHLRRSPEARAVYEEALELATQTGSPRLINFQQGNLAVAYADGGDYVGAIRLLEDVLTRERDPYLLAYRHGNLSRYLHVTNDVERAASHISLAIDFAKQSENHDYLPALYHQATVLHRDRRRLDAAFAAAAEGLEHLERLRARLVPLDFMKRGFGERWQLLYADAIGLYHQEGDHARALVTSEMARARAFLDLLASRDLADRHPSAFGALGITGPHPLPSERAAATASTSEIAATATRLGSTIVSYWVTDDRVLIWVAAPDGRIRGTSSAVTRAKLDKLVEEAVPRPELVTIGALAKLHALLIQPVRSWLPAAGGSLTIVPHGPLFRVSFAALRDPAGVYLVERHPLAYAPSISTLALTAKRAAAVNRTGQHLLVADPAPLPASTPPLARLPASRREVSGIAGVVGARRVSLLWGARAGEADVRRAAASARVLHFATHGVVRDDEPFETFLAVGATGQDAASDGRLTVRELYDLQLNAELVVMSACRTAIGPLSGDGIAGLSRALFYAGTPSIVATLWDVADDPSSRLMAAFYRHWAAGLDKRAALRRAQLDLVRDLRAGSVSVKTRLGFVPLREQPFYWAGYILVGER